MELRKLVGFKKFSSKEGKLFCVANCVSDYTSKEKERGNYGAKVETIFLPEACVDLLTPADIGKDLILEYTINEGKAYLDDVRVLDPNTAKK